MNFIKKFFIVFLVVAFVVGGFFSIKSVLADFRKEAVSRSLIDLADSLVREESKVADNSSLTSLTPKVVSDPVVKEEEQKTDVADPEAKPIVVIISPSSRSYLRNKITITAKIITDNSIANFDEDKYSVVFWLGSSFEREAKTGTGLINNVETKIGTGIYDLKTGRYSIVWDTTTAKNDSYDIWAVVTYDTHTGDIDSSTSDKIAVTINNALPVITILGSETINLEVGDSYIDEGATALDNTNSNITSSIIKSGTFVNTETAGTYTILYNVSDKAGNKAIEVTRTINIEEAPNDGGGSSGSSSGSSGSYIIWPIAPPVGQVLGATTDNNTYNGFCNLYVNSYIKFGSSNNNVTDVVKLQLILNKNLGTTLITDGNYDYDTVQAVNAFQRKYRNEVLTPWIPYGLEYNSEGTGYVYKTTQRQINLTQCPGLNIPMPVLP